MNQPGDDIAICRSGKVLVTAKYTDIIALIEKGLLRITRLENGCIKAVEPTEEGVRAVRNDFRA